MIWRSNPTGNGFISGFFNRKWLYFSGFSSRQPEVANWRSRCRLGRNYLPQPNCSPGTFYSLWFFFWGGGGLIQSLVKKIGKRADPVQKPNFPTPLQFFIQFLLHRTLWIISKQSISTLKVPIWNSLILSTPSVPWNFGLKVYDIDLFFYVSVYVQIIFFLLQYKKSSTKSEPSVTFILRLYSFVIRD